MPGPDPQPPTAEEVRRQLQDILESQHFRTSKRSQQFLRHVVDCTLRGDVLALKESCLGSVLFGRDPGYNASSDPAVRVRANDVRRRLLAYYHDGGAASPVRIELFAGSYMPRFCHAQPPPADPGQFRRPAGCLRHAGTALPALLAGLAQALGADWAYIAGLSSEDDRKLRTVAVIAGGETRDDFEYPVAGSPCEQVFAGSATIYTRGVQREFPNSAVLRARNAESYAGAPLFDSRGEQVALLAVLSARPLLDRQLAESLLHVYAARVATELDRAIAEQALHETARREAHFRGIFASAAIGILIADREGRLIQSNPALQRMLGYSESELDGRRIAEITHPGDVDTDLSLLAELFRGERDTYQVVKRYVHNDGRTVWGRVTVSLLASPFGTAEYWIGIAEDITDRNYG